MTSRDDGMDWFDAPVEGAVDPQEVADPKAAAIEAVGHAARVALFNQVWAAFAAMNATGKVSRASLARSLNIAPQAVSRLLRSPTNMTIETAARLLFVMGRELRFNCPDHSRRERRLASYRWQDTQLHFHVVRQAELRPRANATLVGPCTVSVIEYEAETEVWIDGPEKISGIYSRKPKLVSKSPTQQRQAKPAEQSPWEPQYVH